MPVILNLFQNPGIVFFVNIVRPILYHQHCLVNQFLSKKILCINNIR